MSIPYLLILTRFLAAPAILLLAFYMPEPGTPIVVLMTVGLLSDILDGIIARHQNLVTEKMRRLDSQTDLVFWLSTGFASWHLHSGVLRQYTAPSVFIFVMEFMCYFISIAKFKRETCTHAYLSKLFGVAMFAAFFCLFAFNYGGIVLQTAVIAGILSHIDRILITLILPEWTFDVPSAYHAYQIRKGRAIKKYKLFN
jgi:CDP-diacylglycerol--glycerol-3-phosphate 3-phosphatidyltransferase